MSNEHSEMEQRTLGNQGLTVSATGYPESSMSPHARTMQTKPGFGGFSAEMGRSPTREIMAIIDTFLKLMMERRAESLVLVSDRVPFLLTVGQMIELSMPPLREDMLRRISREMIGEEERYEGKFRAENNVEFGCRVHPGGPEWRVEIHTLGAVPREDPAAEDPLTRAVAGFIKTSPWRGWSTTSTAPARGTSSPSRIPSNMSTARSNA